MITSNENSLTIADLTTLFHNKRAMCKLIQDPDRSSEMTLSERSKKFNALKEDMKAIERVALMLGLENEI